MPTVDQRNPKHIQTPTLDLLNCKITREIVDRIRKKKIYRARTAPLTRKQGHLKLKRKRQSKTLYNIPSLRLPTLEWLRLFAGFRRFRQHSVQSSLFRLRAKNNSHQQTHPNTTFTPNQIYIIQNRPKQSTSNRNPFAESTPYLHILIKK